MSVTLLGQDVRKTAKTLFVPATIFLLIAGIGAAASYVGASPEATGSEDASFSLSPGGSEGETLARLNDYTRSIGTEAPQSVPPDGKLLPDVDTMIERLAARLETTPDDSDGWRMLGWSYFHTGRYDEAATAYARAVKLDPSSAELKRAYEDAKAKASQGGKLEAPASLQTATAPSERDAQIRSMVDGLAGRLERSPQDVEGWTRLMRSRVVLGETELAQTAFRKALAVFKDNMAASGKIMAAARELGLKAE